MKRFKIYLSIFLVLSIMLCSTPAFAISTEPLTEDDEVIIESKETLGGEDELQPMMMRGCGYTSVNQMQMMVLREQAPKGVVAVHSAHQDIGLPHVHFINGALNIDGSVHDGEAPTLTNDQRKWLLKNGWGVN